MNTKPIICPHCGAVDNYHTEPAGPHIKAVCRSCDRYIKFLPQAVLPSETDTIRIHFGRYAGELISTITDARYLQWLIDSCKNLNGKTRSAIEQRLKTLTT